MSFWIVLSETQDVAKIGRYGLVIALGPNRREIAFGRKGPDRQWHMAEGESKALPADKPKLREWADCEMQWDSSTRKLSFVLGTAGSLNVTLGENEGLDGTFSFGFGGGKEARIKDAVLTNK